MKRSAKITIVVSCVVVVGLVALAFPAIGSAVAWASERVASDTRTTVADPKLEPTVPSSAESTDGTPDGYVYMGDNTWIPEGGPGDCPASTMVSITGQGSVADTARLLHPENLIDMGAREFAVGEVGYDDEGRIATYTVASGDSLWAIGDRFCINNGLAIGTLNGHEPYESIQPGQVLVLNPAAVPDFKFEYP